MFDDMTVVASRQAGAKEIARAFPGPPEVQESGGWSWFAEPTGEADEAAIEAGLATLKGLSLWFRSDEAAFDFRVLRDGEEVHADRIDIRVLDPQWLEDLELDDSEVSDLVDYFELQDVPEAGELQPDLVEELSEMSLADAVQRVIEWQDERLVTAFSEHGIKAGARALKSAVRGEGLSFHDEWQGAGHLSAVLDVLGIRGTLPTTLDDEDEDEDEDHVEESDDEDDDTEGRYHDEEE